MHSRATSFLKVSWVNMLCTNTNTSYIHVHTPDETVPRFVRLQSAFASPMTEIYLLFYEAVLQTFVNFNKFLQREDPLIPVISEQIESFLTKLASKFISVSGIKAAGQDFAGLKYSETGDQLPGTKYCSK